MRRTVCIALLLGVAVAARAEKEKAPAAPAALDVVILGKTQLFASPDGFPAFTQKNAKRGRSELSAEVIAKLKEIADGARPGLLEAAGKPERFEPLWLVNAVVAKLTQEQIKAAREHEAVAWIYPAGRMPVMGDPGKVAEPLKPVERGPFDPKGKEIGWHLTELKVPAAWKKGVTGEGVVVMSYDMGLDYRQQDLRAGIYVNPGETPNNGKDDDGNGLVDDVQGWNFTTMKAEILDTGKRQHGTLTSCLVVGDGTGGIVTGVAPRARVLPVKGAGGPYIAARALQYGIEQGADVCSMSFSIPKLGHVRGLWRRMAEHATAAGMVLVSGAGNFGKTEKVPVQIRIPEGIPCVLCVGGVTRKRKVPGFVSQGPVEWGTVKLYEDHPLPKGLVKPDVVAFPGPGLPLVKPMGEGYLPKNNGRRGNSLSAPQAAGVCALVLSANPELTPWRVKALLEETAKDLKPRGKDTASGAGLLNAEAAVKAALATVKTTTPGGSGR